MTKAEQFFQAQNKFAAYDDETKRLVGVANGLAHTADNKKIKLPDIVLSLRNSFKIPATHMDVLEHEMCDYRDPSHGFCTSSSYLIYSMTGGDKVWELRRNKLHWWLYHKQSGTEFDIANSQFKPEMLHNIYQDWELATDFLENNSQQHATLQQMAHRLAKSAGLE